MVNLLPKSKLGLPCSNLAEEIILGSMLLDPTTIPYVLEKLTFHAFYNPKHKIIYKAITQLYDANKEINLFSIITYFQEKKILETIGGFQILTNLTNMVITTINLEKYITIIQEKYFRRLLILLGKQIIESAFDPSKSLDTILLDIEGKIYTIAEKRFDNSLISSTNLLSNILLDVQQNSSNKLKAQGLLTSFYDLDALTQGFQSSELIVVAGRPSMGKTAFCLNIALNVVEKYKSPVLIFSLEMSRQQLIYRFLAILTRINVLKIRTNTLNFDEWKEFHKSVKNLAKLPIFIDDTPYINLTEIQVKSRRILQQKTKLGLIIVDYLQLMELSTRNENRSQELAYITRTLKILAKELKIPILVLSQLSRNVESRIDKRPILSDLRDSGCLVSLQKQKLPTKIDFNKNYIKNSLFTGKKPVYKIFSSTLKEISGTASHKVFSQKGWLKTKQILFNDKIPLIRSTDRNLFFSNETLKINYFLIELVYDLNLIKLFNYVKMNYLFHNSIEQDADIVLMLYRDDYYNPKNITNLTEILVAKHRNGPLGRINLKFDRQCMHFTNC